MKRKVESVRQSRVVQQYSDGSPSYGTIKMGATFNFMFIDGGMVGGAKCGEMCETCDLTGSGTTLVVGRAECASAWAEGGGICVDAERP